MRVTLITLKSVLEKYKWGGSLCHLTAPQMRDVIPNQLRGTMKRLEKEILDFFKAGRKSEIENIEHTSH